MQQQQLFLIQHHFKKNKGEQTNAKYNRNTNRNKKLTRES